MLIRLSDWGTPGWLLKVIASYLTDREMIVRYRGEQSKAYSLPSGGPMGDILGMIIFLVEVSDCSMDPAPPLPSDSLPGDVSCVPAPPPPIQTDKEIRLKFLDDTTTAECLDLKKQLAKRETDFIGPKIFHDRNSLELISESSLLQNRLNDLKTYTNRTFFEN